MAEEDLADYAMGIADRSFNWYRDHAKRARGLYRISDVTLLIVAAAIPLSVAVAPDETGVAAVLGAGVVVISGLRSVFHWQDNYLRFTQACGAVEGERRLYEVGASPYADPASRDKALVAAVSRIEQEETGTWLKVAAPHPEA